METGYQKQFSRPFGEVLQKTRGALAQEGFGVISEIDVKEAFMKKIGKDLGSYVILGACHPDSAYAMLETDRDLGLLLPCNVIVYQKGNAVTANAVLPTGLLSALSRPELLPLARKIEGKLKKAIDSIQA